MILCNPAFVKGCQSPINVCLFVHDLVAEYWTHISSGNAVVLVGTNVSFRCYSSYYERCTWHFYSLTSGACTFGSETYRCASEPRASLSYSSSPTWNRTTLTISSMEMSDAVTSSLYDRSNASAIIVGVIGQCTRTLQLNLYTPWAIKTYHFDFTNMNTHEELSDVTLHCDAIMTSSVH